MAHSNEREKKTHLHIKFDGRLMIGLGFYFEILNFFPSFS